MGKKKAKYVIESEFDDLHGNPDDMPDLDLDLSDSDNPIIAAADVDDDWQPPEDEEDDKDEEEDDGDEFEEDDTDDDSELEELDDDDTDKDLDEDDEEEEDEDDDEDEKYSRNVRARIDRERNLRLQEKQQSDQRLAKLERKLKLRDAKDEFNEAKQNADSKLKSLKLKKTAAMDEGETAKVVDIDDEILDIKADLKAKELQLKQTEDSIDDDTDDTSTGTPEVGRKFLAKYPEFHTNAQFRNVLLLTDKIVAARNFDKNTEEYYAEIEKIMKPQFPKIIRGAKITKKRTKKPLKRKRSAVGGTQKAGTRTGSSRRMRKGRIRLTKADQQQMEIFGMDPTNPADAKAWAQGKGN